MSARRLDQIIARHLHLSSQEMRDLAARGDEAVASKLVSVPPETVAPLLRELRRALDRIPAEPIDDSNDPAARVGLLNATIHATPDGVLVVDHAGHTLLANERFAQMWRIPREIYESRDDARMLKHVLDQLADPEGFIRRVQELYARDTEVSYETLLFKDGRVFERFSKPVDFGRGPKGRIWLFRDVTAQRRAEEEKEALEEQLRQSQKMDAVGKLAGGVAHDFNNLLTVIIGYAQILQSRMEPDDPRRATIDEIRKAGQRASGLTRQLLAFSRKQVLAPRVVDLNVVVSNMDTMMRRLIGEDIHLETHACTGLRHVKADPGQIEQVILNLVVNARDAMPEGGRIVIETENLSGRRFVGTEHEDLSPGAWVMVSVSDTGCGMDATTQAHIFEPFFTTKESGRGTGLGLSTAYGIITQSGGRIFADSAPGRGTTFRFYLPAVSEGLDAGTQEIGGEAQLLQSETILLVEDEDQVRKLASVILKAEGYNVLEAAVPGAALEICRNHAGRIDLMLTDVIMPRMNGRQLYEEAIKLRKGMQVLYISGYTDSVIEDRGMLSPNTAFLQKPFTPDSLTRKVHEILSGRSSRAA